MVYVRYVVHSRKEVSRAQAPEVANAMPPRLTRQGPVQDALHAQSQETPQSPRIATDKTLYLLEELNSTESPMARELAVIKAFSGPNSTTLASHIATNSSEKELVTILQILGRFDAPSHTIEPMRILINRLATRNLNSALTIIGSSKNTEFRKAALEEIMPYLQVWDPEAAARWSSAVFES